MPIPIGVNLKLDGRLVKVSSTGLAVVSLVFSIIILPRLLSSEIKVTLIYRNRIEKDTV